LFILGSNAKTRSQARKGAIIFKLVILPLYLND
jgi:hypothetical protein